MTLKNPKILAPAGDKNSFLAAIAAGADAIYCGLKIFSARMAADNFSIEELSRLTKLAKSRNIQVYIAFNSIIKDFEQEKVFKIMNKLIRNVEFQALIVQDIAMIHLAKKAGFTKEIHLSTLGNCTFPSALKTLKQLGFKKVVLPREFTIDEIKTMALHTPKGMALEVFIHGALCFCISGRCYWSSWFGGKSSLRGRCVQPCRRRYIQKGNEKKYFSCMDFSADVLAKVLKTIPQITTWKIEGRKKSPHYVYYTVRAYKLLRDDPKKKKQALAFLDYAMGRQFTHYNLLSQRKINPLDHSSETGSGLFAGRIKNPESPYFITRHALFASDLLRIGFEDEQSHSIQRVTRAVPGKGKFYLGRQSKYKIRKGTPVYIIDRRDKVLAEALQFLNNELENMEKITIAPVENKFNKIFSKKGGQLKNKIQEIHVSINRHPRQSGASTEGLWISSQRYSKTYTAKEWLWLDPVLFPDEEKICSNFIKKALKKGNKNFVLNSIWQICLFQNPKQLNLWAGPFCNITNSMTLTLLKSFGFSGAIVSPELDKDTLCALPGRSELPLGIVIYGNWPLGISRIISQDLKTDQPFTSPKGEMAWFAKYNNNYFVFPNWYLDLRSKKQLLQKAGFSLFVNLHEPIPSGIKIKNRPGLWNWNLRLL